MLYVIRHGKTDWNLKNKIQGRADIPLNAFGIQEAKITKELLKQIHFYKIISSPLIRAKKTAEIISNCEIPVITDSRIIERDFGEFEGLNKEDFDYSSFWNYSLNNKYIKAENIQQLLNRVYNFLDEYKEVYEKNNVLVVTHSGVIPAICCYFKGIPKNNNIFTYKDMIYEMYEALNQRETPIKVVLRISMDKWHIAKIGLYRYALHFPDGYKISVGIAQIFHSNLKVNLKNPNIDLEQLITLFDNDMKYNSFSNPSLVKNKNDEWGLDFLISYNGNIATWGNEQLYGLNNLYTDSYENIISNIYTNIISYSLLDKGYFYRTKIISEVNPLAVLRSKAIHIRDYAGASILEENHTVLYYAIRVIQDYLEENVLTLEELSGMSKELLDMIKSKKYIVKKWYQNTSYSIIKQYMEKSIFDENEWRDLFNLIYFGHYTVSKEQIEEGIRFFNKHARKKINQLEDVLENSKEHYQRLIERLTFMKPEAKRLCMGNYQKLEVM